MRRLTFKSVCSCLAVLTLAALPPHTAQAQAPVSARAIYEQDFTGHPTGGSPGTLIGGQSSSAPLPGGVYDNTYTGKPSQLQIIHSAEPQRGNVLQARLTGFGQIVLGSPLTLKKGLLYRVSLDLSSTGAQNPTLMLRRIPWPYTSYLESAETTNEQPRHVSFIGKSPDDDNQVGLFLVMTGFSTLTISHVKVEELAGTLPPAPPPTPGNKVINAGFEVGSDGWFTRDDGEHKVTFAPIPDAFEGRRAAHLGGRALLSSSWFRLVPDYEYLVRARIKSLGPRAAVSMNLTSYINQRSGGIGHAEELAVTREEGWKTVSLRWRVPQPQGKISDLADFNVGFDGRGDDLLIDSVEVRPAGEEAQPYAPRAIQELALFTDAPGGVMTQGEKARVQVLASGNLAAAILEVRDEMGALWQRYPLRFQDGTANVALRALPPGYWHLLTTSAQSSVTPAPRIEGENFLAVVPPMPNLPTENWFYGTHITDNPATRLACWKLGLRWDRLHDTCIAVKWPVVQPDNAHDFNFRDDEIARHTAQGQILVGNLDSLPAWVPRQPIERDGKLVPRTGEAGLGVMTDEGFPLWQEFCRRTAAHFKGKIDYFEIGNELNLSGMSPEFYLRVLEAAYKGIKAGNPDAKVVGPAVGGALGDAWLNQVIKLGGWRYLDAITFHGYAQTTWNSLNGPEPLQRTVADFRQLLKAAGADPNLPLWDGESGITPTTAFTKFYEPNTGSPLAEAEMMAKMAACARAAGLQHHLYYATFSPTVAGEVGALIMFDLDGAIRMAYQPLGVANSLLEGRAYVEADATDAARGIIHLVFSGRGQTVHMLWKLEGTATLKVPPQARLVNMWGREIAAKNVTLNQQPMYFVMGSKER